MDSKNSYNNVMCRLKDFGLRHSHLVVTLLSMSVMPLTGCGVIGKSTFEQHSSVADKNVSGIKALLNREDSVRASLAPMYSMKRQTVQLPSLQIPDNAEVNREIHRLAVRERRYMERVFKRKHEYHDVLGVLLSDEGVPKELLALAVVESGLDRLAKSPAGAVGMWQFMAITAREFNLRVNAFEDERKDPILSTIAAARMLQRSYKTFGSWELALASYNCGAGGVKRQIAAAGGETNFWTLSRRGAFNKETREFVPKIMAVAAILKNPSKYGFKE